LDRRVDVEFAFHPQGLAILQAREILQLPSYFPNNPLENGEAHGCCHNTRTEPFSPFLRALYGAPLKHESIPSPPWPLEVESVILRHGRLFYRSSPEPEYLYQERPDDPEEDRTFMNVMQALDDPNDYFHKWYTWTDNAYDLIIPGLQQRNTYLLSLSEQELASLEASKLSQLLWEVIDLENQAAIFSVSSSFPTSECVSMLEKILRDWLKIPDWHDAVQFAMTLIQGIPTLTHELDTELQDIAPGTGDLDRFICKWGYSCLARDEQLYFSDWKSWREDPRPLYAAIKQMQKAKDQPSIKQKLKETREESDKAFYKVKKKIEATDPDDREQRGEIFAACVHCGRKHFRMKDDRDLVWSHAQAALRWILMEAARRLKKAEVIQLHDETFMFRPDELFSFFEENSTSRSEMSEIA